MAVAVAVLAGRGDEAGAVAVASSSTIRVHSLADGSIVNELRLDHGEGVESLAAAEIEGTGFVVYVNRVGQVCLWEPFPGNREQPRDTGQRRYVTGLESATTGYGDRAVAVADCANIVSSNIVLPYGTKADDGRLFAFELSSGRPVEDFEITLRGVAGITAFDANGDGLIAMGGLMSGSIFVSDMNAREVREIPLPEGSSVVTLAWAKANDRDAILPAGWGR
uniref:hypothetical protein n=1 Tax=Herbidospora sakaeratensis TaxID=564415 RepID=UPI000783ECF6|nr:hypothetical protein [Herbidospora sakaeratensis]